MTVSTVRHGDVEIAYETIGPQAGEPLLLVMGTGTQMLAWHPGFCAALVERGFQVTRFDNRDCGLSTRFTADGPPNQLKMWLRPASVAAYRLEDMADDAVAVLDAQGHQSAHVVGCSLGGMIAQVMATRHPERVRSLTSISSTPSPQIGRTRIGTLVRFAKVAKKPVTDADSLAQQMIDLQPFTGSPVHRTIHPTWNGCANSPSRATSAATTSPGASARPRPSRQPATAAATSPRYARRRW